MLPHLQSYKSYLGVGIIQQICPSWKDHVFNQTNLTESVAAKWYKTNHPSILAHCQLRDAMKRSTSILSDST